MREIFLLTEYEKSREEEALRLGLDKKASWDQIFEKTAILVCRSALIANIEALQKQRIKVASFSWDSVIIVWALCSLERIREENAKKLKLHPNATWEEMSMIKTEKRIKTNKYQRRLNRCRRKWYLTEKEKDAIKAKEAAEVGLSKDTRWRKIIKQKSQQLVEEEVSCFLNLLGFSPETGFEALYEYVSSRFSDENRKKEATSHNLKETATWDQIMKAKKLKELNLKRKEEALSLDLKESASWDEIITKKYLIDMDCSRKEAAKELGLPVGSRWSKIIAKESFTIIED